MSSRLKTAREKQGLSLREAARQTHISEATLRALEQNQPTGLQPAYESKLEQSYARFLGLSLRPRPIAQPRPAKRFRQRQIIATTSVIRTVMLSLAVAAVVGYGLWQLVKLVSAPALRVDQPADNSIVEASSLTVRGKTGSGSEVFINNQQVTIDPEGNFEYQLHLRRGVNEIEIVAVNNLAKKSAVKRTVILRTTD